MNFQLPASSAVVENLGWTLLHSLWQIAILAALLFLSLKIFARQSANLRYLLACAALILTLALPLATFIRLFSSEMSNSKQNSVYTAKQAGVPLREQPPAEKILIDENDQFRATGSESKRFFAALEIWQDSFAGYLARSLPVLVWLWLAGVMIFAVRMSGGLWHLHLCRKRKNCIPNNEWQIRCEQLCKKIGVSQAVKLYESALTGAPVVIGWLKPIVLVPSGAFLGLSTAQMEAILVHELMHIRRHDYFVNLTQSLIEILLFYHPCARWISAQIRELREFACDDAVVKFYDGDSLIYARALVNLEQFRSTAEQSKPQLSLAANGGKLMKRIKRIVTRESADSKKTFSWAASLVASLLLIALGSVIFLPAANFSAVFANSEKSQKRAVAVGFVALPAVNPVVGSEPLTETTDLLIGGLKKHDVPAIGFVMGGKIDYGNPNQRLNLLRRWRDAGLEIGIGTYKHTRYFDTSFENYIAEVTKNEATIAPIFAEKNQKLRWFSYPFLNTGKDLESKARFENWLKERGYKFVPYTIDNDEWIFSKVYQEARQRNDAEAMQKIRAEYIPYMRRMFEFYENYSRELFNREIPQILLLTPSRLNADAADELFGMIKERGYQFITMDEAVADKAFQAEDNYTGKTGISWLQRWGISQGKQWRDEPKPEGYMEQFNFHKGGGNLKAKTK